MPNDSLVANGSVTFEDAAGHALVSVPKCSPHDRSGELRRKMIGQKFECASHAVVCDGNKFMGIVRVEELLSAPDDVLIEELMDKEAPKVAPGVDQEVAAWHAVRHGESALCVVDEQGGFVGLIPPHRLLAVLLSEHEEDLSRLGGFLKSTSGARTTSEEAVSRRFWHRVPWLLIGLAGALLAADFVGWFESQIEHKVMLTFFLPGIVYLADAVGTQTETVVVRGLSVGVSMRRMFKRELLAGLAIGVVLAVLAGGVTWWRWGDQDIALCLTLALFAACLTATCIAMALPWLISLFGQDPAFGSGPLATVIQDLLSILIYFAIATAIIP